MKNLILFLLILSFVGVVQIEANDKKQKRRPISKQKLIKKKEVVEIQKVVEILPMSLPKAEIAVQEAPVMATVVSSFEDKILPKKSTKEIKNGNVLVEVSSNQNTWQQLGLAPRAMIVIEFPEEDPLHSVYTGDKDYVDTFCLRKGQNGECADGKKSALILVPGKDFHNFGNGIDTTTVITVQRQSGITFTFFVSPVKNISDNSNHVVIKYDKEQVISSRKSLGLATNLGVENLPLVESVQKDEIAQIEKAEKEKAEKEEIASLEEICVSELKNVADNTSLKFQKPLHGLSLAVYTKPNRLKDVTVEVVAIRNVLNVPIKLVPNEPKLVVESMDGNKKVNAESLKILHIATTADSDDILKPGEVYYYAFAYNRPILGAKQFLRISFAQTDAADEPITASLSGYTR